MAKKNNSRKVLAVALGIVGVAGLSLASASTLTVNVNDDNIAVGTNTFDAACDDAVTVDYTYSIPGGTYTNLLVSDISEDCVGKTLAYTLHYTLADNTPGTIAATPTVVAGTSPLAADVTASIAALPLSATLNSIDIAIY